MRKSKKASRVGKLAGVSHAPSLKGPGRKAPSKAELREELARAAANTAKQQEEREDD